MTSDYAKKLKDPRWQKKRLEILNRDEWNCQICHDSESTLVVHHRRYLHGVEPWDYPDSYLVTLCEDCHEAERTERPDAESDLIAMLRLNFFTSDIASLTNGFHQLELLHTAEVVASVYEWALSSPEIQGELTLRYFNKIKEDVDAEKTTDRS